MNNPKNDHYLKSIYNKILLLFINSLRFVLPFGTFLICTLIVYFINYIISIKSSENAEMLLNILMLIIGYQLIDYLISYQKFKSNEQLTSSQERKLDYKSAQYKYYITTFYVSAILANRFIQTDYYVTSLKIAKQLLSTFDNNSIVTKLIIFTSNIAFPFSCLQIKTQIKISFFFRYIVIAFFIALIITILTNLIRDFYSKQKNQ